MGGFLIRGSEWNRWDLHVHTPCSFHSDYKIKTEEREKYNKLDNLDNLWDKFIDYLENIDKTVKVIGITDYFSIDGYKKVLDYCDDGRLKNIELFLPNIEFRVDLKNNKFNYHIIFSNELEPEVIEEDFLQYLTMLNYEGERVKLSRKELKKYGSKIKQNDSKIDKTPYHVGCEHIYVSWEEMNSILNERRSIFDGKYMNVVVGKDWRSLKGRAAGDRKRILKNSHAVFSSNDHIRDLMLGKKSEGIDKFKDEYGTLKPCFHGSDSHSFDKICKPNHDSFCWIKSDTTFDGLKQTMYEPEDRIKIQTEIPENRKSIYSLDYFDISNSDDINDSLSIKEDKILFNKNLITILGGKGTGKTALLDLIANCFEDRCSRGIKKNKDPNSFVQRVESDKSDLNVEIGFIGEIDCFKKNIVENEFFESSKIMYLPQGKIETYSSDKDKLDKKIEEIIFSNPEIIKKNCKEQFNNLKDEIREISKAIDDINYDIYSLEQETEEKAINDLEKRKTIKFGELEDKNDELNSFKKKMEESSADNIEELKKEQDELKIKHSELETIKSNIETLENELKDYSAEYNGLFIDLNDKLDTFGINSLIPDLDFEIQLNSITEILEKLDIKINEFKENIFRVEEELNKLSGNEEIHAKLIEDKTNIKTEIEQIENEISVINGKKQEIEDYELIRLSKYHKLLEKYYNWNEYYKKVIYLFSKGKDKILGEIDFDSKIYFDSKTFLKKGESLLNKRKIKADEIAEITQNFDESILKMPMELKKLEKVLTTILNTKQFLKDSSNNYEFYNWIFKDYFSLSTNILFNGRPMDKLSMGQKGTVLLKLFLAEGEYPLIVDQPEDNLDNRFVYNELVGAFRNAKSKRQIIIATNNANLVVNTDAEQVIIAEFINNEISYKKGSLENPNIRKNIMSILEGGKEAFKQRERKYDMGSKKKF